LHGLAASRQHVAVPIHGRRHCSQANEALTPRLPVSDFREGELDQRVAARQVFLPRDDEPLLFGERKGTQQDRVQNTEDGGASADAEGQRQHGDRREAQVLAQRARAVPQVLPQVFERPDASHVPALLTHALHAAEVNERDATRLLGAHPARDVALSLLLQVEAQLVV
jgi:hypothetical protein